MKKNSLVALALVVSQLAPLTGLTSLARADVEQLRNSPRFQNLSVLEKEQARSELQAMREQILRAGETQIDGRKTYTIYSDAAPTVLALLAAHGVGIVGGARLMKANAEAKKNVREKTKTLDQTQAEFDKASHSFKNAIDRKVNTPSASQKIDLAAQTNMIQTSGDLLQKMESIDFAATEENIRRASNIQHELFNAYSNEKKLLKGYFEALMSHDIATKGATTLEQNQRFSDAIDVIKGTDYETLFVEIANTPREELAQRLASETRRTLGRINEVNQDAKLNMLYGMYLDPKRPLSLRSAAAKALLEPEVRNDYVVAQLAKEALDLQIARDLKEAESNLERAKTGVTETSKLFADAKLDHDGAVKDASVRSILRRNKKASGLVGLGALLFTAGLAHGIYSFESNKITLTEDEKDAALNLLDQAEAALN